MLRYLWISGLVVLLDQLSKWAAVHYLLGRPRLPLLPFLDLQLAFNRGAAFGFLSSAGGWQNLFFTVVALGISAGIIVMLWRLPARDRQLALALALILGGALGNVIDRVQLGYVVDFILLYYKHWHWPNFNIADSAITIGAVLMVLDSLGWGFGRRRSA